MPQTSLTTDATLSTVTMETPTTTVSIELPEPVMPLEGLPVPSMANTAGPEIAPLRAAALDLTIQALIDMGQMTADETRRIGNGQSELGALTRDERTYLAEASVDYFVESDDWRQIWRMRSMSIHVESFGDWAAPVLVQAAVEHVGDASRQLRNALMRAAISLDAAGLIEAYHDQGWELAYYASVVRSDAKVELLEALPEADVSLDMKLEVAVGTLAFSGRSDWQCSTFLSASINAISHVVSVMYAAAAAHAPPPAQTEMSSDGSGQGADPSSSGDGKAAPPAEQAPPAPPPMPETTYISYRRLEAASQDDFMTRVMTFIIDMEADRRSRDDTAQPADVSQSGDDSAKARFEGVMASFLTAIVDS